MSEAMDAIAGYVIVNDLSARDYVRREGLPNQVIHDWFGQKSFRDSMPMGPWLTPAEFIPNPYDLNIRLWVNDQLKQDGNSKNMIYPIAEQISYLSKHLVLQPGRCDFDGMPRREPAWVEMNFSSPAMRSEWSSRIAAFSQTE